MSKIVTLMCGMLFCLSVSGEKLSATTTTTIHHAKSAKVVSKPKTTSTRHVAAKTTKSAGATKAHVSTVSTTVVHRSVKGHKVLAVRRTRYYERFTASSFADNLTLGDVTEGEDPVVREAAIEALGNMNGTAIAIDPTTGRILAMVNQKLALSSGAEPCSTIKLTVALAALEEGLITKDTPVNLGGGYKVDLTYALAKSVNPYFEVLGRTMGFERVKHYANQFGLGELAGWHIEGEQLGTYPDEELPQKLGGVGRSARSARGSR
jgi:penicillin-binding protein 2